jgi:hypothetical protein
MKDYIVEVGCVHASEDNEPNGHWELEDCEVSAKNPTNAGNLGLEEIRGRYDKGTKGNPLLHVWVHSVYQAYADELDDIYATSAVITTNEFVVSEREER